MSDARRVPRRRNLSEDVAEYIREGIMSGALRPGTRIDQDAIAADLGVSRLPVREALISLDKEGLINTIPRRGAFVARMEREISTAGMALPTGIAAQLAARGPGIAALVEMQRRRLDGNRTAETVAAETDRRQANEHRGLPHL